MDAALDQELGETDYNMATLQKVCIMGDIWAYLDMKNEHLLCAEHEGFKAMCASYFDKLESFAAYCTNFYAETTFLEKGTHEMSDEAIVVKFALKKYTVNNPFEVNLRFCQGQKVPFLSFLNAWSHKTLLLAVPDLQPGGYKHLSHGFSQDLYEQLSFAARAL